MNDEQRILALRLFQEGKSINEIAKTFNVHNATIYRFLDKGSSTPHKNTPLPPAKNTPPLWCPMMGGYVPLLPGTISKQIIL